MPKIGGELGIWQQDWDRAVGEASCAGMNYGQVETGRSHEPAVAVGAGEKTAQ